MFFSVAMQRKLTNPRRNVEIQRQIQAKTKELNEMSKNKASNEQLAAKQKEVTTLLSESMRSQFKPMLVVLPVFFLVYYMILPAIFASDITVTVLSSTFDYKTYFIIVSFIVGFALSMGMMAYDKKRFGAAQNAIPENGQ